MELRGPWVSDSSPLAELGEVNAHVGARGAAAETAGASASANAFEAAVQGVAAEVLERGVRVIQVNDGGADYLTLFYFHHSHAGLGAFARIGGGAGVQPQHAVDGLQGRHVGVAGDDALALAGQLTQVFSLVNHGEAAAVERWGGLVRDARAVINVAIAVAVDHGGRGNALQLQIGVLIAGVSSAQDGSAVFEDLTDNLWQGTVNV